MPQNWELYSWFCGILRIRGGNGDGSGGEASARLGLPCEQPAGHSDKFRGGGGQLPLGIAGDHKGLPGLQVLQAVADDFSAQVFGADQSGGDEAHAGVLGDQRVQRVQGIDLDQVYRGKEAAADIQADPGELAVFPGDDKGLVLQQRQLPDGEFSWGKLAGKGVGRGERGVSRRGE